MQDLLVASHGSNMEQSARAMMKIGRGNDQGKEMAQQAWVLGQGCSCHDNLWHMCRGLNSFSMMGSHPASHIHSLQRAHRNLILGGLTTPYLPLT